MKQHHPSSGSWGKSVATNFLHLSAMSPCLVWQPLRFWPRMLLLLRLFLLITQASVLFLCSQEGHSFPKSTRNPVHRSHRTQYNQAIESDHWTVFGRGFGTRELWAVAKRFNDLDPRRLKATWSAKSKSNSYHQTQQKKTMQKQWIANCWQQLKHPARFCAPLRLILGLYHIIPFIAQISKPWVSCIGLTQSNSLLPKLSDTMPAAQTTAGASLSSKARHAEFRVLQFSSGQA